MSRLRTSHSEHRAWGRAPARSEALSRSDHDAALVRAGLAEAQAAAAERGDRAADLERVQTALEGGLDPAARRAVNAVRAGLDRVGAAIAEPMPEMPAELLRQTDLPELSGDDPLTSLAIRLDHEADLWRGVAFRQLGRAAWAGRVAVIGAVTALAGELALAAIGGFRALFGGGLAGAPPLLLGVSAAIVALGAVTLGWVMERTRRSQLDIARGALTRADLAEARLHRIAAMMQLSSAAPERYLDALSRLERDMRESG